MENKKIIYITNARLPTEKAHGYQMCKMCEMFAEQNYDVEIWLSPRGNYITQNIFDFYGINKIFKVITLNGIDWFKLEKYIGRFSFYFQKFFFLFSLLFKKIDKKTIVYSRDPEIIWLFKIKGNRAFYNAHTWPERHVMLFKYFIKNTDGIVCNSLGTEVKFKKEGFLKIIAVHNGIDLDEFNAISDDKKKLRNKLDFPENKKIVMYVGHLYKWKGVDVVFESAIEMRDRRVFFFVIVGGNEKDIKKYNEIIIENKLKNVLLLGYKKKNIIPLYLKSADVLLLPNVPISDESSFYTSPIKMFEYMASKVPIIVSDLPSMREVLNENNSILIEAGNSKVLTKNIQSILSNKNLASELSERAYKDVIKYSWYNQACLVLNFFEIHNPIKNTEFYDKESEYYSKKRYPLVSTDFTHFFFKKRLSLLLKFLKYIGNKESNLLEIGCADGVIISSIRDSGVIYGKITGIDISEKMIDVANNNIKDKNVRFYVRGSEPNNIYDVIVEIGVINFTDFYEEIFYVSKHLNHNGHYIVSVSSSSSMQNILKPQNVLTYRHLNNYHIYEEKWKEVFDIINVYPYGLFVPFLWRFPSIAGAIQPILENVFSKIIPNLFHEKIYILRLK